MVGHELGLKDGGIVSRTLALGMHCLRRTCCCLSVNKTAFNHLVAFEHTWLVVENYDVFCNLSCDTVVLEEHWQIKV